MAKGGKQQGAGRPKGSANKIERCAKKDALEVFWLLGGTQGMYEWAVLNQEAYYSKVFPKLIPKDVTSSGEMTLTVLTGVPEPKGEPVKDEA